MGGRRDGGRRLVLLILVEEDNEDEDEAEDILRRARTGAGHAVEAMGNSKGPGAVRAGVRVCRWRGACVARVSFGDVVIISRGDRAVGIAQVKDGAGVKLAGTAGGVVGEAHVI